MPKLQYSLLAVLSAANLVNISTVGELQCSGDSTENQISLSVNSAISDGGEWATSFLAHQNTSLQSRKVDVNVTRRFVTCQGRQIVQIGVFLKEMPQTPNYEVLTFKRCSRNAAITNNGRTLEKLQLGKSGSAFTSRPLIDGEIFTVRIDANDGEYGELGPAIGLTTLTLEGQDLEEHSNNYKSGTWMLYGTALHQNGSTFNNSYLKKDLSTLQVGQTLGVMRTRYGTLHFFIDGVDQGPAASNIPTKVYGIFELRASKQGTIVDV